MNTLQTQVKSVTDKLQQLLKTNMLLKKENELLTTMLEASKQREHNYKISIESLSQKVNVLQAVSGNIDKEGKKILKKINLYIKEIDKYIVMLSE